jgi:hypothetical protein
LLPQLEGRLDDVHVQPDYLMQLSEGLTGRQPTQTGVTKHPADNRSILLINPGLIILLILAGSGEHDLLLPTVRSQRFVDERPIVVGVDAARWHRHLS